MLTRMGGKAAVAAVLFLVCWGRPGVVKGQATDLEQVGANMTPEQMADEAVSRIDSGDLRTADALIRKAKLVNPTVARLRLAEGLLAVELRQYPTAIGLLNEYNETREGKLDYRGFATIGTLFKESRSYREAIRPLENAKNLAPMEEKGKPVRALVCMDLAFAYLGLDRKKDAAAAAKEAEAMAPSNEKIQFFYAQIAASTGDFGTAETAVKKAAGLVAAKVQNSPFDRDANSLMQSCLQLHVRIKQSQLEARPDDGALRAEAARLLCQAAEYDRRANLLAARELLLPAIEHDPKRAEWQVLAAQLEWQLGSPAEAATRLEGVLDGEPENKEAASLLEQIRPGEKKGEASAAGGGDT